MHPRAGACLFRPRSQPCQRSPRRPRAAGGNFLSRGSFKRRLCHIRRCRLTPHGRDFPARLPAPPSHPVTAGERRRGGGAHGNVRRRGGPAGRLLPGKARGFCWAGRGAHAPCVPPAECCAAAGIAAATWPKPCLRHRAALAEATPPGFFPKSCREEILKKRKKKKKYLCKVPPSAGAAAGFYQEEGERGPHFILFSYLVAPFDGNVICVISRAHTGD